MSAITSLQRGAIDRAAITLERAFSRDPAVHVGLSRLCHSAGCCSDSSAFLSSMVCAHSSHEAKAACVWLAPGPGITIPRMIRSGMLGVPFRTGFGPFVKFMTARSSRSAAPDRSSVVAKR